MSSQNNISTENDYRCKSIKLLTKINELSKIEVKDLEIGILNYTIDYCNKKKITCNWNSKNFIQIYLSKLKSIYSNLKSNSYIGNTNLIKRLKDKEFLPHELAYMNPQSIYPKKWESLIELKIKMDQAKHDTKAVPMTDRFKCSRCHKKETSYYEMQTRSADEPTTIFITCLNCNSRWKQ